MKLIVLAGAKKDAVVPLRKERFVIGRGEGCALRAGSSAISRKHCEIKLNSAGATARDLGSRNGTYVNDAQIQEETALSNGDLLRIGPLEFRFESEGQINNTKDPQVTGVADVVARTSKQNGNKVSEQDLSDWLIEGPASASPEQATRETQTFKVDEIRAITGNLNPEDADQEEPESEPDPEAVEVEAENSGKKSKKPGKLPKESLSNKTKDSREAAMQILRDMARRR